MYLPYPSIELDTDCSLIVVNDHFGHMCIDDCVQVLPVAVVSEVGFGSGAARPPPNSSLWDGETCLPCSVNVNIRISV